MTQLPSRPGNLRSRVRRVFPLVLLLSRSLAAEPVSEQRPSTGAVAESRSSEQLLDEYVRLAVERSPVLAALRAKHAVARELVAPSGALPDPMVGMMYQSVGPPWQPMSLMSMVQGEVTQAIPGRGKRQARRDAALAEANVRHADIAATKARLVADVRSLFAQIYASDQEQRSVESSGELVTVMAGAITGQFASGKVDQEALAKVELERNRLTEQQLDIRTNRAILVTRLNRLLARTEDATVPSLAALPVVAFELEAGKEETLSQSPELRVQRAAITAAARRQESAKAESRPNYLVGLAGGATLSGEPVVTLRFGVELPLWRSTKQEPLIRAAQSDIEVTENEYRALELKLRGDKAELVARLRRDADQSRLYREAIVPNASLALHAGLDAYSTGRGDFAMVIENFRRWLDAQVGLARREADRFMTWAELRALTERVP